MNFVVCKIDISFLGKNYFMKGNKYSYSLKNNAYFVVGEDEEGHRFSRSEFQKYFEAA